MQNDYMKVLNYWLGETYSSGSFPTEKAQIWFKSTPEIDREITGLFKESLEKAAQGGLDSWTGNPQGYVALIILLDQFSRNIYRGTPQAFSQDPQAFKLAQEGVLRGIDGQLTPVERSFFYLPYEHCENLAVQDQCVALFEKLADESPAAIEFPMRNALDYAIRHQKIIARFGRFPHRNKILGRTSTPEEIAFLNEPNSSF